MRALQTGMAVLAAAIATSCATLGALGSLVRPPRIEAARDREAELRLFGPGAGRPLGGAGVRLWASVENPNSFGLTLSTLSGRLFLDESDAAAVDLPLGLPLAAREATVVPIDISVDFEDLPALARVAARAAGGAPVDYRLDGTIGVDAGSFGRPTFGPMTLLRGEVTARR